MRTKYVLPLFILLFAGYTALSFTREVDAAEQLPEITLTAPEDQKYRDYLGITASAGDVFNVVDIQTDILVIELFSMYCPYCQAEAPRVNELFSLAEKQKENGVSIKIIGLGASNTQFEVDYFKDSFDIQFPLFPDKTLQIYKLLGGEGTPGFIGTLFQKGKKPEIVMRQSGGFDNAEEFLTLLLEKAGYLKN